MKTVVRLINPVEVGGIRYDRIAVNRPSMGSFFSFWQACQWGPAPSMPDDATDVPTAVLNALTPTDLHRVAAAAALACKPYIRAIALKRSLRPGSQNA
ncbi:MAG: hypothetical protein R3D69_12020 [Xanthobacteraceae bacterium]